MERDGVQSVQRAFDVLEAIAGSGGHLGIGEIAVLTQVPLATVHRLLQTLVTRGYVRRLPDRRYALGFRLVPLALTAGTMLGPHVEPVLERLVNELGESANLAILSGDEAEYAAQVPSRHAMRMFTEIGRRVELHCTGVGKAMLAQLSESQVREILARRGLPAHTPHTIATPELLWDALAEIRSQGYALDEQEQELGVRCVAVPVLVGTLSWMALSISGPVTRMTDEQVARAIPRLQEAARELARELSAERPLPGSVLGQTAGQGAD